MFLNQYVRDRPFRALAINLSPTGLLLQKLIEPGTPLARVVSLEFELPETGEVVWACAEPRFDALDRDFQTTGLTFTGMAGKHERLLREFILEKSRKRWRGVMPPARAGFGMRRATSTGPAGRHDDRAPLQTTSEHPFSVEFRSNE